MICDMRMPNGYSVLMETPLIANAAGISRTDGGVKIANIELKVQAPQ